MADRSLAIRLAVIDGGKTKAELRDIGDTGSRSLKRIEDAARPASRALQALDGVAGEVRGGLEAMSGRLGAVGSGLARLGPLGLAAGAALAGVGIAVSKGVGEAAKADQSYRRLEAVLRATGHASGLTAKQIVDSAEGIEASTLATAEGVQDAAVILATFRSVSGETFTRTLTLAQDMAAVFGQDLSSAATQLGKALENPIDGLTALRRVGISFSDSQKELIRTLVETGQTADAQRVILDALAQQVGGAGAAEAGGLTGATNRLQDAWGNFLKVIGRTPAVTSVAQGALDLLSRAIEGITSTLRGPSIDDQIAETTERLAETEARLEKLRSSGNRRAVAVTQSLIEDLRRQLDDLTARARSETASAVEEQRQAEAGRLAAEAERRADLINTQRREIERALSQIATDPSERIARINRELAETRRRLEALRAPGGENAADVDAAIAKAEELARRQIEVIERPAREAATRTATANAKVIEDLSRQLAGLGDERRAFIDQALSRLSEGATAVQRAEVERLASSLFDEREAREQLAEAMRQEERLREQGRRVIEATRTPAEQLAETIEHLGELMRAGAIDAETHGRALADAYVEAEAAADRSLRASREWQDGVTRGLRDYVNVATDAAAAAERVMGAAFQGMEDALVQFVMTGKMNMADLAKSMLTEINRVIIRMLIALAIQRSLGAAFGIAGAGSSGGGDAGLLNSAVFHRGGVVGHDPAPTRLTPAVVYAMAPRYHAGGIIGAGEVPAILRRGEGVFTPSQMRALGGVNVTVHNHTAARVSVSEIDTGAQIDIMDVIDRTAATLAATPGSRLHSVMRNAR